MLKSGLSLSSAEIKQIIDEIKCPSMDKIKYSEFLLAAFDRKRLLDEEMLYMAFRRFDVVIATQDNDGFISEKEMQNALLQHGSTLKQSELEAEMKEYDQNSDHRIDFEEFKSIIGNREAAHPVSDMPPPILSLKAATACS